MHKVNENITMVLCPDAQARVIKVCIYRAFHAQLTKDVKVVKSLGIKWLSPSNRNAKHSAVSVCQSAPSSELWIADAESRFSRKGPAVLLDGSKMAGFSDAALAY